MKPELTELIESYREGKTSRRKFMKKLAVLAGSTAAATSVLALLDPGEATAGPRKDPDIELTEKFISYPGKTGEVRAFLAVPAGSQAFPAVIVIHENKGLQPHIRDVASRMAREGFLSLAPDALSPLGGTPDNDPDKARSMIGQLDREDTVQDMVAAVKYLKTHPRSTGKVGCTGFCWGGGMTNQVAVNAPDLDAAVPYYGAQPAPEDVPRIKAPILAHYAGDDARINAGIETFEEALKKAGIEYHIYIYEGAKHAFNNDTNPERYNKEAADLAWKRTIKFFKEKLGG